MLLALALGAAIGSGATVLVVVAERRAARAAAVVTPHIPDGVDQVLDAMGSAAVVVDPSGNVLRASDEAKALELVTDGRLTHRALDDLAIEVRQSGEPVGRDYQLSWGRFGDTTRPMYVRAAPLGTRFIVLIAEDRSEAERLEEVRRDFIANISHELKTPIGAVSLLAEALEPAADEPDRVRRFATRLSTEAARLAQITSDIISLSRLQASDVLNAPSEVSINQVVSRAIEQNRVTAEGRGIDLVLARAKHAKVMGDAQTLEVAVHNLIANAIAYSPEGTRVGVGIDVDDGVVSIAVTDQGIGIAPEDQDRVFERFFRVDPARARATGGTGLGLSIVKHAAQNHGGQVRLWSQPGRGSTFTIQLPQAATDAGSAADRTNEGAT
ncbi:Phosphate regulon sensor protein PhoR (SphS) [Mycetocola reblochoni REB411]|uniref:Sensor-like histidine kinase SenX3 n=2 Tax=Mycetocola reblochoni TaxID=331618 RepID=A0A1R4JQM5_9MICO|nr:Phosphate regulon sensor protein PhoR (SphS) [Mycetocola reblochoni REB411]